MTSDYEAPDPRVAELIYHSNAECDRESERLKDASTDELKNVLQNPQESTAARAEALLGLMGARVPEINDLILELIDDPNQELWRMSILGSRAKDPRIRAKLISLLDDPDDENWSTAATGLAFAKDESLFPRYVTWLKEGDEPHRNVAVECLKFLGTRAAINVLCDYWDGNCGDDELRLHVAAALFEMGDRRGHSLLKAVAERADGAISVFAATIVYCKQKSEGLSMMLKILNDGNLEAKQAMVNQIWNFESLPHAFTADGLAEARVWAKTQLERLT